MTNEPNPKPRPARKGRKKPPEEDILAPWRSEKLAEDLRSLGTVIVFRSGSEHAPQGPIVIPPLTDLPGYGPDPRPRQEPGEGADGKPKKG